MQWSLETTGQSLFLSLWDFKPDKVGAGFLSGSGHIGTFSFHPTESSAVYNPHLKQRILYSLVFETFN